MNIPFDIDTLLVAIIGSSAILNYVFYRNSEKRSKAAEATIKEVEALRNTVGTLEGTVKLLQGQIKEQDETIKELRENARKDNDYINELQRDKRTLETKHSKNKSAINESFSCKFCEDKAECPVLIRRSQNETEYLESLK